MLIYIVVVQAVQCTTYARHMATWTHVCILICILKRIRVVCLALCQGHMARQLACCYADAVEGVFVFLGIGNSTLQTAEKLHTPRFKMDDSMMPVGAALHASMALQYLRTSHPAGKTGQGSSQAQGSSDEL